MAKSKKSKKDRAPTATTEAPPERAAGTAASGTASGADGGKTAPAVIPPAVIPPAGPSRVEAKLHAKPALGPDPVLETAQTGLNTLRENWQVLAAGVLVLIVAVVFVTLWSESKQARTRLAWEELRTATDVPEGQPLPAEKLRELLERYPGTTAEPFILLRLGDAAMESGGRDGNERAIGYYQRVLAEFGSNKEAAFLAERSLQVAKKTLTFDPEKYAAEKGQKVEWAKGETAGSVPSAPPSR